MMAMAAAPAKMVFAIVMGVLPNFGGETTTRQSTVWFPKDAAGSTLVADLGPADVMSRAAIPDSSTWSRPCNSSTARSARGRHPCLGYDLLTYVSRVDKRGRAEGGRQLYLTFFVFLRES